MRYFLYLVAAGSIVVGVGSWKYFTAPQSLCEETCEGSPSPAIRQSSSKSETSANVGTLPEASPVSPAPSPRVARSTLSVPFTAQAPTGNWKDMAFQNACEEASILMAMRWAQGKLDPIAPNEALREIQALIDWQKEKYGHWHDRSTADTAQLIKDYFGYNGVEVKKNITVADIKGELKGGNIVIVPANGQKLANPFYTPPGPLKHMLVIKGYDQQANQFITNDPGTRRGEGWRYNEQVLITAIRDYPTGYQEPIAEGKKVMIVVIPAAH